MSILFPNLVHQAEINTAFAADIAAKAYDNAKGILFLADTISGVTYNKLHTLSPTIAVVGNRHTLTFAVPSVIKGNYRLTVDNGLNYGGAFTMTVDGVAAPGGTLVGPNLILEVVDHVLATDKAFPVVFVYTATDGVDVPDFSATKLIVEKY